MKGYDMGLIEKIRETTTLPVTVLGGAGSIDHLGEIIEKNGIIGASAGSLFIFKGPYKAVLINYPDSQQKNLLYKKVIYENKK